MFPGTPRARQVWLGRLPAYLVVLAAMLGTPGCVPAQRDNSLPEDVIAVQDSKAPPADTATDQAQSATPDVAPVDAEGQDGEADAGSDAAPLAQGCGTDTDCQDLPAPPCQKVVCNPKGLCVLQPGNEGQACGGDACVGNGTCTLGQCSGTVVECDDKNACTTDSCHPKLGCRHSFADDGTGCDDGDLCTSFGGSDSCKGGTCVGKPVVCQDDDPCTVNEHCNPKTGACINDGAATADKIPCTTGAKACQGPGVCQGKTCVHPATCDDGDPCTVDVCTGSVGSGPEGCIHQVVLGQPCSSDLCVTSQCVQGPGGKATCQVTPNCTNNDPCKTFTGCDPKVGVCSYTSAPEDGSQACVSKDPCVINAVCVKKQCKGTTIACDDGNPCTVDPACTPGTGCTHTPADGAACNDGSACTSSDACSGGLCVGKAVGCDDGNPCTTDTCATASGCAHAASADGTVCGSGKKCQGGTCAGTP